MKSKLKLPDFLKNKYALIVLAVGLVLLLIPMGSKSASKGESELTVPAFSVTNEETRLASELGKIKGVGRVSVLLSVKGSAERELAENKDGTLLVSENGEEKVVDLYYENPKYMGAVVVCDGAGSADVRLEVTKAVAAYTGLETNKITVMGMN